MIIIQLIYSNTHTDIIICTHGSYSCTNIIIYKYTARNNQHRTHLLPNQSTLSRYITQMVAQPIICTDEVCPLICMHVKTM